MSFAGETHGEETRKKMSKALSKYRKHFCGELLEYFGQPVYEENSNRKTVIGIPTLGKFAFARKVTVRTLERWGEAHPEFAEAVEVAMEMQKDMLADGGLIGLFQPQITKFLLSANHGLHEKIDRTDEQTNAQPLEIRMQYRDGMQHNDLEKQLPDTKEDQEKEK